MGRRAVLGAAALLLALFLADASAARAGDALRDLEGEFRRAIEKVTPATVICVPATVPEDRRPGSSSGVIVSRSGLVLSDGDPGAILTEQGALESYADAIEVRVPDLKKGGFAAYEAVVVHRDRASDSTLLRVVNPPAGGFKGFLAPATSDHLQVGDFVFAMGNAFGLSQEAPPTLTAGIVSSLTYLGGGDPGGRIQHVYTSAAINPGVNGGPLIDVEGRLVGTVSTFLRPGEAEPYQFLGKVVPMDRLRALYADLPEADELFPDSDPQRERAKEAAAFELVLHHMATRAYPAVVSLEVERSQPLSRVIPTPQGARQLPRFLGPVSGILVDADGWIVTSLYNLTNISALVQPGIRLPPEAQVDTGIRAVSSVTVHFSVGSRTSAQVVAHDARLGIALLKADMAALSDATVTQAARPLAPAPADSYEAGRFVLALGNPFGQDANPDPLLTVGVLSKQHAEDALDPWRGQWQTDAGATDANCGGAVIDLRGRLVGMLQIWSPPRHGRNSGIGFVVTWDQIAAALPDLKEGRTRRPGTMGVNLEEVDEAVRVQAVVPGSPAAAAGLLPGDRIRAIDGHETPGIDVLRRLLLARWAGDRIRITVERGEETLEIELVLGARG
ncbi:MAG: S1C family serine protease [Planctomycetota bacterium]|jgi:S1-C subfamily serine protease